MTVGGDETARTAEQCFYICPIGSAESDTRKRSDQIYKHIIAHELEPYGYNVVRADQMDQSGMITSQVINSLLTSDLVVADLTDHNPNVYYELAIRHAVRKPFIQLIAESQELPFDIQGLRTIPVDHRDLDSVAEARSTLIGMVDSIRSGKPVETPLTYTLNLKALEQSEASEARGIAGLMNEVQSLKELLGGVALRGMPAADKAKLETVRTAARAFGEFIDILLERGHLSADDLRTMMYMKPGGTALGSYARSRFKKYFPDEPPF